ncbi:hypothetical protein SERLADRAFT_402722, partial [Serpula lacrymans var. lacrymans S7.9]
MHASVQPRARGTCVVYGKRSISKCVLRVSAYRVANILPYNIISVALLGEGERVLLVLTEEVHECAREIVLGDRFHMFDIYLAALVVVWCIT